MAYGTGVNHLLREAVTWIFVIGLGFGTFYYYDDILGTVKSTTASVRDAYEAADAEQEPVRGTGFDRSMRLRADRSGHFAVSAHINGRPVSLMADTGATLVALTYESARSIGFTDSDLEYNAFTNTANGKGRVAVVSLDRVRVGDIMVRNVRAMVLEPGKLHVNLLGMSFIGRLSSFEMRGNELILNQ